MLRQKKREKIILWLVFSFIAAIFSSFIAIFAKTGVKNVNSDFATFYRTGMRFSDCKVFA